MSVTCYWPTDTAKTLIVCADILLQHLSSWLMDIHTVGHSAGFFNLVTVNTFLSVKKMMLMTLGECF